MLKLRVLSFTLLALPFCASAQPHFQHYEKSIAPYVVSPQAIVDRMLEIADLKPNETVYDLGSGDGRVLFAAVRKFRAKAVGVEISDSLVKSTNERIQAYGFQNRASVVHGDLLEVDLSPADVVTIYLMTNSNAVLRPRLEKFLHPGARVISHEYAVPGWKPKYVEKVEPYARGHVIYLYVMPADKK
jgi:protein-L-isoaspartate O-methyltransferase